MIYKLNDGDLDPSEGCVNCGAVAAEGGTFFLVDRPKEATDLVVCEDCKPVLRINGRHHGPVMPQAVVSKGQLVEDEGVYYRVVDVQIEGDATRLVLQDLDDPQHQRIREVG